jgi:GAF domain-containing protein
LDIGGGEEKRAFDEHDIWLAELFAAQSAVALENTRLFEATQARAEREQRVRTITERIRQGRDTEAIMRIALEELGWMLGASTSTARLGTREQLLEDQET